MQFIPCIIYLHTYLHSKNPIEPISAIKILHRISYLRGLGLLFIWVTYRYKLIINTAYDDR